MIRFTIPVRTKNPLNGSQGTTRHAALAKAAARKKERNAARLCTLAELLTKASPLSAEPCTIRLTRVSAGQMNSHDGLRAALKGCVDGICDGLGTKDEDPRLTFDYAQQKCERGSGWVEVTIE